MKYIYLPLLRIIWIIIVMPFLLVIIIFKYIWHLNLQFKLPKAFFVNDYETTNRYHYGLNLISYILDRREKAYIEKGVAVVYECDHKIGMW